MTRVFIAGIFHETHSFSGETTGFEGFEIHRGAEITARVGDASQIDGFLSVANREGWEVVPSVIYTGGASGTVDHEVFETFWGEVKPVLEKALAEGLDAIHLSLHGAMVTEFCDDGEGEILSRLRAIVGPALPIAITLAATPPGSVGMQAAVLAAVALGITILVYGAVALIVKADDVGLALAASERPVASLFGLRDPGVGAPGGADRALTRLTKPLGRGLVVGMPYFLSFLSGLGVVAMAWVGGGILLHGLHEFGVHGPGHVIEVVSAAAAKMAPDLAGIISWIINAVASALFGLAAGAIMIPLAHLAAPLTRIIIGWVRRSKTPAAT
jgi:hypothetical protein